METRDDIQQLVFSQGPLDKELSFNADTGTVWFLQILKALPVICQLNVKCLPSWIGGCSVEIQLAVDTFTH
jgi:hypothetical protein